MDLGNTVELAEVLQIHSGAEAIVVPHDKIFDAGEPVEVMKILLPHDRVAEYVDNIALADDRVPLLHDVLVHSLDRLEVARGLAFVRLEPVGDTNMAKMEICDDVDARHEGILLPYISFVNPSRNVGTILRLRDMERRSIWI